MDGGSNQTRDDKLYAQHNRSVSTINSNNSNNNCTSNGNPKMGSRRIFTPQFKLQVLESYRSDSDCKGNQRATARKYNIHRRQIQKWLQCESSLRSSVANLNSEKQQFHNINVAQSHQENHRELTRPRSNASPINMAFGAAQQLSLESGTPSLALHTMLHAMPSRKVAAVDPANTTHKVFSISNFTAGTTDLGLVAAATTTNSTSCITPLKATAVALQPAKMVNTNNSNAGIIAPPSTLLSHHYHEHHYGITSCSQTPLGLQISVPILSHPFAHHHHQLHPHILADPKQNHYQYQSTQHRSQILTHHVSPHLPSMLSRNSPSTAFTTTAFSKSSERNIQQQQQQQQQDQQNYNIKEMHHPQENEQLPIDKKIPNKKQHIIRSEEDNSYPYISCSDGVKGTTNLNYTISSPPPSSQIPLSTPLYQHKDNIYCATGFSICPMDLSLGNRNDKNKLRDTKPNVVDLTFKKRKILSTNDVEEFPRGTSELYKEVVATSTAGGSIDSKDGGATVKIVPHEDDIDVEIDIEDNTPPPPPAPAPKPVKLFKPYLLDDDDDDNDNGKESKKTNKDLTSTVCQSSNFYDNAIETTTTTTSTSTGGCNFQNQTSFYYVNQTESPNFLTRSKTASPISAFSPTTSLPTLSPSTLQGCKDSPMSSGYESSSSSHSDTVPYRADPVNDGFIYGRTSYSVNLHMQQLYTNDNIVIPPSNHIQSWLDQDNTNLMATNSSIALYA